MENLSSDLFKNYLNSLKAEYSESSFNRKLSSLRRFLQFLKEKGKIDNKLAREMSDILNTRKSWIKDLTKDRKELTDDKFFEESVVQASEDSAGGQPPLSVYSEKPQKFPVSSYFPPSAFLIILLLFFSLNFYLFGKMNSNLLERIDAAVTRTKSSDEVKDLVLTLTLTIDATLTDNFGIPLSYEQDVNFAIYPTRTTTSPIYTTGLCQVKPNDSGRISVDLGLDCGHPISYSLFTQYPELYLGMSIGFGSELQPRFALKKLELLSASTTSTSPTPTRYPTPTSIPLFVDDYVTTESANVATDSGTTE